MVSADLSDKLRLDETAPLQLTILTFCSFFPGAIHALILHYLIM